MLTNNYIVISNFDIQQYTVCPDPIIDNKFLGYRFLPQNIGVNKVECVSLKIYCKKKQMEVVKNFASSKEFCVFQEGM